MIKLRQLLVNHKAKGLTFFDQAILSGSSFLITIILTRLLGLDQVGIYALLWILVLFGQSLHQAAIVSPMLVFGAKKMDELNQSQYLSGLFALHLLFSFVIAIGVAVFMFFYLNLYPETMLNGIQVKIPLLILLILNNDFFRKLFYIRHRHHIVALIDMIAYGLQLFLLVFLGLRGDLDLSKVFSIMIGTQLLASVICLFVASFEAFDLKVIKTVFKWHTDFSVWLLMAAVFQWFAGNVLLLVGGKMLSMELIGALRIMQNLMGVLNVILLSFESYIPISAAKIFDHSGLKDLMRYLKTTVLKATALFALPLLLFFFFSKPIITLAYGAQHADYAYLLKGYTVLYVFIIFGMILRIGLRAIEQTRPVFFSYVFTAAVSALLAKQLISRWEDIGIIVGLIIAQVVMIIYYSYLMYRNRKVYNDQQLSRV